MAENGTGLRAKLKKTPTWVWISIGVGVVGVVIAWLIYQNTQNNSSTASNGTTNAAVPSGGTYVPSGNAVDPSLLGGASSAGAGPGLSPDVQAELLNMLAMLELQQSAGTAPTGATSPGAPQTEPQIPPASIGVSGYSAGPITPNFGLNQPSGTPSASGGGLFRGLLGGAIPPQPGGGNSGLGGLGFGGGGAIPPQGGNGGAINPSVQPGGVINPFGQVSPSAHFGVAATGPTGVTPAGAYPSIGVGAMGTTPSGAYNVHTIPGATGGQQSRLFGGILGGAIPPQSGGHGGLGSGGGGAIPPQPTRRGGFGGAIPPIRGRGR